MPARRGEAVELHLQLPRTCRVALEAYDNVGRRRMQLELGEIDAGVTKYPVVLGLNEGVYRCRVIAGESEVWAPLIVK
jgi:hypothetical protein